MGAEHSGVEISIRMSSLPQVYIQRFTENNWVLKFQLTSSLPQVYIQGEPIHRYLDEELRQAS